MKKIEGLSKSIRSILKDKRYYIDYYQREYRWRRKQVQELLDDLLSQFLEHYSEGDDREEVETYGHYFLGSVIFSSRDNRMYIVDGQQRLTTISLLLMLLNHRQGERGDKVKLSDLIFSERYGRRSFNIAVPEREVVMDALFHDRSPDLTDASESVQTIVDRFEDMSEILDASEIDDRALPFFCDWLIDNVHLVEITAATDEDAYTIFETMNDRGLSLTPLDMLKGYLLANIKDSERRSLAADIWKRRVESLRKLGKDEDSDAVKAWLRAKRSQTVRARQKGAENQDFEKIGTEFHRWVGSRSEQLGLADTQSYFEFVQKEMRFYTELYERLRKAAQEPIPGLEPVYHVAAYNFTLQFPMLLAPLCPTDSPQLIDAKVRTVARFLDIMLARRSVNYLSMTFSALNYTMFGVIQAIRDASLGDLVRILRQQLDDMGCEFTGTQDGTRSGVSRFGLNQWSKRYIKILLARMTHYIETESGMESSLASYLASGKFEIEHIWADHPDRHSDEFTSTAEFAEYRNRFGGLLLLPKQFNASYGDLPYVNEQNPDKGKLRHYLTQNLLARSLHEQCYERHPGFQRFIGQTGLPFRPHTEFRKADLDARQTLYQKLAERVWSPDNLLREAEA